MIPVMIWGSAVNGKSYKSKDYIVALMVTTGCAMFAMMGALPASSGHCIRLYACNSTPSTYASPCNCPSFSLSFSRLWPLMPHSLKMPSRFPSLLVRIANPACMLGTLTFASHSSRTSSPVVARILTAR
jgi:hypothetical protein